MLIDISGIKLGGHGRSVGGGAKMSISDLKNSRRRFVTNEINSQVV